MVIYCRFGGYYVPDDVADEINCETFDDAVQIRSNPKFIDWVEKQRPLNFRVVEIPDNATDYIIMDYDGWETVLAVIDGKIIHV